MLTYEILYFSGFSGTTAAARRPLSIQEYAQGRGTPKGTTTQPGKDAPSQSQQTQGQGELGLSFILICQVFVKNLNVIKVALGNNNNQ